LGVDELTIFIKGTGNFRTDVAQTAVYKGTRPNIVPTHYAALREYITKVHGAIEVNGMEADDAASVELWKNRDKDSTVILAAMDKDLWNTPGWHFNYDPRKWFSEYITVQTADRNFIRQILTGDRSDNIIGLPRVAEVSRNRLGIGTTGSRGVGPSTAEALLRGLSNKEALIRCWELYKEYGAEQGFSEDDAREYFVEQGKLLWMTRELNPDGTPVQWEPPSFLCS
jgi:hypothetical protein